MANIPVGTRGEQKLLVTSEVAINFLGMEGARVLSTPHMIGFMETDLPGYGPAAARSGSRHGRHARQCRAPGGGADGNERDVLGRSDRVNERRIQFRVEAWDEKEKIGEGTHERAIINIAKFATRLAEKKK